MANNHEIRFKCNPELIEKSNLIYRNGFQALKKQSFMEKVYILGLSSIQEKVVALTKSKTDKNE